VRPRIVGRRLERARLASPFLLRSIQPPLTSAEGRVVLELHRLGKRIAIELEDELFLAPIPGKVGLLALDFEHGTLVLTEAGTKRQASLHVVAGRDALREHNPGGLEVLDATLEQFVHALTAENHTVKRALTDPHLFSGIGNAYSDEILHAAQLSPFKLTQALSEDERWRLFDATRRVLDQWIARLQAEAGHAFPEKVTAFRKEMAVHGKYGQPCPDCGTPVQRVVYAANEANYCPTCQTGGRLLADRSLSRLLKEDWPKTLEELERRKRR
jgi:formamidopyrimidine-DNA glycosylase